jgi:hypothetical protein
MLQRIAIILERNLEAGEIGNVAAILMGQLSLLCPEIYDSNELLDLNKNQHAGIQYSTVLLKAGQGQMINLVQQIKTENIPVRNVLFTEVGQKLHNQYDIYQQNIRANTTEALKPVGVGLVGSDEDVRRITKKFSLFK